jgi:hypothetical protein
VFVDLCVAGPRPLTPSLALLLCALTECIYWNCMQCAACARALCFCISIGRVVLAYVVSCGDRAHGLTSRKPLRRASGGRAASPWSSVTTDAFAVRRETQGPADCQAVLPAYGGRHSLALPALEYWRTAHPDGGGAVEPLPRSRGRCRTLGVLDCENRVSRQFVVRL